MYRFVCALALLFVLTPSASATTPPKDIPTATVSGVYDGDTVEVTFPNGTKGVVRVIGIDAPEKKKCFYEEARAALVSLSGATVTLAPKPQEDRDKYGRMLRYIALEGRDVGTQMLRYGFARAYPWFPHPRKQSYTRLELRARKDGYGLWSACK